MQVIFTWQNNVLVEESHIRIIIEMSDQKHKENTCTTEAQSFSINMTKS